MADLDSDGDTTLLPLIKEARIQGKSFYDIERLYKISAPRAEAILSEHYKNRTISIDPNEARMLQYDRLESLIDVLMSMAQLGNVKSAEVLLKTFEQINELLGLNLQATKTEIRIITDEQSSVVFDMVRFMLKGLLTFIQNTVTDQHELALIEDAWEEMGAVLYGEAVRTIAAPEVLVLEGAGRG